MKADKEVIIAIVFAIMVLEAIALIKGFNGVILTAVIAILAGLVGWTLPQPKIK